MKMENDYEILGVILFQKRKRRSKARAQIKKYELEEKHLTTHINVLNSIRKSIKLKLI